MTFTLRYLKGTDKKAFASGALDLEADHARCLELASLEDLNGPLGHSAWLLVCHKVSLLLHRDQ